MELIIENGRVLQEDFTLKEQSVVVSGAMIKDRGSATAMRKKYRSHRKLNATGHLVFPGLVNAHTHAALTLAAGMGPNLPVIDTFKKVLFPMERKVTDKIANLGAMVFAMESLRAGTTTVNNINATWSKPVVKAFKKMGLRGTVSLALKDRDITTDKVVRCRHMRENIQLVKSLQGDDKLTGMFGIANELEATSDLIRDVVGLAKDYNTGVHTHVAETTIAKGFVLQKTGKTSIRYMYDLGALTEKSLAIHAVNITRRDINILSRAGCTVVHCPISNLNMETGISPILDMLGQGVSIAIGVDHPLSNMNYSVFRELNAARVLQRSIGKNMTTTQLLQLGFNSRMYGYALGSLKPGSYADIITIDVRDRALPNDTSLLESLLATHSAVSTSIIGGEFSMRNGQLMGADENKVLKKAQLAAKRLA